MAENTRPATKAENKSDDKRSAPNDVASEDLRARGAELKMSDRDAGSSHLAAQNQVPQEGALVTDPPQPEPPHDSERNKQDKSVEGRTVEFPEERKLTVPNEFPRGEQK